MWMGILIGLSIITKVHGYTNGRFPEVCASMSPVHNGGSGKPFPPQTTEPPFEVFYQAGNEGEPITVSLQGKGSATFRGFMLEAREKGMADAGRPVGKFILPDSAIAQLLTCSGSAGSAVSQIDNRMKHLVEVNWTAEGEELDITFRATFLQSYAVFWERVDVNITLPPSTTPPPSTQPTTTSSTTGIITSSTTPNNEQIPTKCDQKPAGTALMALDILFELVKMELPNIVRATVTDSPLFSHRLIKVPKILCSVLCAAVEISALVLYCVCDSFKVTLVVLVCVVMAINFIELVIISLPIGPSHELKDICGTALKVCSIIHMILSFAVVFIGVLEIDHCRKNWKECCLLKVMIAYTAWILLFVAWVFVFSIHGFAMLGRRKRGSGNGEEQRQQIKKELSAAKVIVTTVSVIFMAGTTAFTAAVIVGIFSEM